MTELSWITVESSNVNAVAYADGELFVEYRGGGTYVYATVPEHVFEALRQSDSTGRFMNAEIKPHYACRRL